MTVASVGGARPRDHSRDGDLPRPAGPEFSSHLTWTASQEIHADGTEFTIDRVSMVGSTGTYLNSPFHRYLEGTDLAGLPLTSPADLLRWWRAPPAAGRGPSNA